MYLHVSAINRAGGVQIDIQDVSQIRILKKLGNNLNDLLS